MSRSDEPTKDERDHRAVDHDLSKPDEGGTLVCSNCGLKEKFHYFGRKPPFARSYTFVEDVYVAKDPFTTSNARDSFLLLGAECCHCHRVICQNQKCSLFYSKRFCMKCAFENIDEFPEEMKQA